jgi:hypothetical protein
MLLAAVLVDALQTAREDAEEASTEFVVTSPRAYSLAP